MAQPEAEKPGLQSGAKGVPAAPAEAMFLSAPTAEDLRPTATESRLIVELLEWQERSAKSLRVLGEPIGS